MLPLSLIHITEAAEAIASGLLLPIIKTQWHLNTIELSMGLTIINLGIPLGSLIQGLADKYGRKAFILIITFVLIFFGVMSAMAWNFPAFVVIRFFYQLGIGMSMPLTSLYAAEVTPTVQRASMMNFIWNTWTWGYIFSCTLGYFFFTQNKWRIMILLLTAPSLIALLCFLFYGRESLHYLWARG
jgi:MFS family permease